MIGFGRWGTNILRDLLALNCSVSVVDSCRERLDLATMQGAAETMLSPHALVAVDAIVIATPSSTHAAVIEAVSDRLVPIFIEKPMTTSIQSAKRVVDIAGDRLFVMNKWRYHPAINLLADLARSNELGPIVGLSTQRMQWGNSHRDVDGIWILAPHDLSIAREIFGYIPEPAHALADCHDGVPAGLYAHFKGQPWLRINVSIRSRQRIRRVELHCQQGIAVFDQDCENQIQIFSGAVNLVEECPRVEIRSFPCVMPLFEELKRFVQYVDGGPPPKCDAAIGYDIVGKIVRLRELAGID